MSIQRAYLATISYQVNQDLLLILQSMLLVPGRGI